MYQHLFRLQYIKQYHGVSLVMLFDYKELLLRLYLSSICSHLSDDKTVRYYYQHYLCKLL